MLFKHAGNLEMRYVVRVRAKRDLSMRYIRHNDINRSISGHRLIVIFPWGPLFPPNTPLVL